VFGVGPAGTGKTYLAMAQAVVVPAAKRVSRIILARPAVEAGEKLGFLPGDLQEKVNPYLRPLYDALYDMLDSSGSSAARARRDRGRADRVHARPHAERRVRDPGRSAEHDVRADEDVPHAPRVRIEGGGDGRHHADRSAAGRTSGLVEALKVVNGIEGISVIQFDERDVVRMRSCNRS
jgi:phosphate starvation-inducible PhoH-like protein